MDPPDKKFLAIPVPIAEAEMGGIVFNYVLQPCEVDISTIGKY